MSFFVVVKNMTPALAQPLVQRVCCDLIGPVLGFRNSIVVGGGGAIARTHNEGACHDCLWYRVAKEDVCYLVKDFTEATLFVSVAVLHRGGQPRIETLLATSDANEETCLVVDSEQQWEEWMGGKLMPLLLHAADYQPSCCR